MKTKTSSYFFALMLVTSILPLFAQEASTNTQLHQVEIGPSSLDTLIEKTPQKKNLKILSWNIYMLPPAILQTGKRQRAVAIANVLEQSDYDIIVFQEAFHPAARNILRGKLDHHFPHQYGPANHKGIKFNSGIWIVSKLPLQPMKEIKYSKCTGYDCYSQKGAMLVEGNIGGKVFQLIGTHLQSEGPQAIRQSQYEQIYNELVVPFQKKDVPQIVCGDFNTSSLDKSSYDSMIQTLDCENGFLSGKVMNTYKGGNDQIDYIFLRKNACEINDIHREIKEFLHDWTGAKNKYIQSPALSDHNAMEMEMEF